MPLHPRTKRCRRPAPRRRRLLFERYESRTLLAAAPAGADKSLPMFEDIPYVLTAEHFGYSDLADTPPNAFLGVKISIPPSSGALMVGGSLLAAGDFISIATINAGGLRFLPFPSAHGSAYANLTFQVKDDGGTTAGGADLDPTPNTLSFDLLPVNDPPTGRDGSVFTNLRDAGGLLVFRPSDFGFSDLGDAPRNSLLAVRISTLPASGELTNRGSPVAVGDSIPAADVAGCQFRYLPYVPPLTFSISANFKFQVQDDGGTVQGGVDLDPATRQMAISGFYCDCGVPAGIATKTVTIFEDQAYTFSPLDFDITEPRDGNSVVSVTISQLPVQGTISEAGFSLTPGWTITAARLASGSFRYLPPLNANGSPLVRLGVSVQDAAGVFPNFTVDVNVTATSDAPQGTSASITAFEDTAFTFSVSDFGFWDPADSPPDRFYAVKFSSISIPSGLKADGVPVRSGDTLLVADVAAGKLRFTPLPGASGQAYAKFGFQVQDDGSSGTANIDFTARSITINITPVNDPPVGTGGIKTVRENVNFTFSTSDFGFTDPNDFPPNAMMGVYITTLPAAGTLTLAGAPMTPGQFVFVSQLFGELVFAAPSQAAALTTSFTFQVRDNGGTFQGGVDIDPAAKTLTLYMARADQQISGQNHAATGFEDTPYTFSAADFPFTDSFDAPYSGLKHISLWSIPLSGKLTYYGANVVLGVTGTNIISAQDLAQGALVYVPPANQSGSSLASFTYYITDLGNNRTPTLSTQTINLTAVNDPPSGADRAVAFVRNSSYTFQLLDFGFTDQQDNPSNSLFGVRINTPRASGTLYLEGSPVSPVQLVTRAQLLAGLLVFTPDPNTLGSPYAAFSFQVQDNGGTLNNGLDLDPTPNTLTISVTNYCNSCNFRIGISKNFVTLEDKAYTFAPSDFASISPFGYPTTFDGISIRLVAGGSFQLGGLPVASGTVPASEIQAGRFRFLPAANANGAALGRMNFDVLRDGGFPEGGDYDATINATPVNDPPVGSDRNVFGYENNALTISVADIGFVDLVDVPANALKAIRIQTLPTLGSLVLVGVPVLVGQIISVTDIASGNLRFVPLPNTAGFPYAAFTFFVKDDGGTASGGIDTAINANTISISIGNVCGRPSYDFSHTATILEDGAYFVPSTLIASGEGFDNTLVTLKRPPTTGTLFFGTTQVLVNQRFTISEFTSGLVRYVPPANANGAALGSFEMVMGEDRDLCGPLGSGVITVHVTPVNDPPSGADKLITTLEDASYTFTAADFGFTDVFDTPPHSLAAVQITSLPAKGTLALAGTPVTAGQRIAIANIGTLVFSPASNANGLAYTSFAFQVQDNGGTANGGQDLDPTPNTLTINVTPVNDPPRGENRTLNLYCGPRTLTMADFGYSDPDDNPPNDPLTVIVTHTGTGTLTKNGVVIPVNEVAHVVSYSDIAAGKLVYTPPQTGSLVATIQFQVQDNGGTANGGRDRLNPNTNLISFVVRLAPQLPPAGIDNSVTILEDQTYRFQLADFPHADAGADNLKAVQIATLPATGQLRSSGVPVQAGQFIPVFDITMGRLTFTPAANVHGPNVASFAFRVQDDGGTACGELDIDLTPNTLTINVTAVNDAPSGQDRTIVLTCGDAYTFKVTDFPLSDAADAPANSLAAIRVVTLPASGALANRGVPVTFGQSIPVADIASGSFAYQFISSSLSSTPFAFQVQDDGGTADGGINLSASVNLFAINLAGAPPVPPSSIDVTVTTLEDQAYVFRAADFPLSGNAGNSLVAVRLTTLPVTGSLKLNGAPVVAGQSISAADIAAGRLTYTAPPNFAGPALASFQFQVQDNSSICGGIDLDPTPNTLTINVTPVNDAPSGSSRFMNIAENAAFTFSVFDFGFADPFDVPVNSLAALRIESLPLQGSFTLNGLPLTPGTLIPAASISAGLLRYVPQPGATGAPYASFTFRVIDNGGTAFGGIDTDPTPDTLTIHVLSYCSLGAPTMSRHATVSALEDRSYTLTSTDLGIFDIYGDPLPDPQGVEIVTLPMRGSLTLSGTEVTPGQIVTILDVAQGRLQFVSAANEHGINYAQFVFQVQDPHLPICGDQGFGTVTLNVAAVNDPPSGQNHALTILEDTTRTFTPGDFPFTDPQDLPANGLASIQIASLPANGSLHFQNVPVTIGQRIPAAGVSSLTYTPLTNSNGPALTSFAFQVQDTGATAIGGIDLDPTPRTLTINVTQVNDPPSGMDRYISITCGPLVLSISDFGYSDALDSPPHDPLGVKIVANAYGRLFNNGVPVAAGEFISLSDLVAGKVVYGSLSRLPLLDNITFQAKDGGGTASGGLDIDPIVRTLSFATILGLRFPPSGMNATVSLPEDNAYTLQLSDFAFADDGDNLKAVRITTLPAVGALKSSGSPITSGQFVSPFEIAMGRFTYTPPANANDLPLTVFTFQIQDDSGGNCVGMDLDPSPNTLTINVTPVNDPPIGAEKTLRVAQNDTFAIPPSYFGFSDPFDLQPNGFAGAYITTLPALGSLKLNGQPLAAGTFVPIADMAAWKFAYQPPFDAIGIPYTSFTFQLKDNGGTADGGSDVDGNPRTMAIEVRYWCGRPTFPFQTMAHAVEGQPYVFSLRDFDLYDSESGPPAGLTVFSLPEIGTLRIDGVPVKRDQIVPAADVLAGKLTYTPPIGDGSTVSTSFSVATDRDQCVWYWGDGRVTIGVLPINQPPSFIVGADQTVTDQSGPQVVTGWATAISAGRTKEEVQDLGFTIVANSNAPLFATPPVVLPSGTLSFTPKPNVRGTAQITIQLKDDGGTANGGLDTSPLQTFTIQITKPKPWHNVLKAFDVTADGHIAPNDALAVINYLNAFGAGPVPTAAAIGPAFYDTANAQAEPFGDNFVTAVDVLAIINHINTFAQQAQNPTPEGEPTPDLNVSTPLTAIIPPDLLTLLALDTADQCFRRRR